MKNTQTKPISSFHRTVIFAIAIVMIHRLLLVITSGNTPLVVGINNTFFIFISLSIMLGMFYVARHSKDARNIRVAWSLYGVGILLAMLGEFIAVASNKPILTSIPSIADVFYLAFYPVFGAGLVLMAGQDIVEGRVKMFLDITIVMLAVFLVFWIVLIAPILSVHESNPLSIIIAVAYPLGDGILILAVLWALFSRQGQVHPTTLLLLALAGTGQVVSDVVYMPQTFNGTYVPGGWLDTLQIFNLSVLLVVIAFQLIYKPSQTTTQKPKPEIPTRQFEWTAYVPMVGILFAYALIFFGSGDVHPESNKILAWVLGIMIWLGVIRQFISLTENMLLTRKLQKELSEREAAEHAVHKLNEELEERVLDRTAALTNEITQRMQAQSDRERLITELEAKNVELEKFTYTVSHDLKAPLITIRGFLGLVEKNALAGNTERVRSDMARIIGAAEKMQRLLDELLELSRIGRIMNPPQAVPFEEIVREAIELVRGRINERGIEIDIAPDLPVVYGDRTRLVQVMQNLIDNATKFIGDQQKPGIEIGQRNYDAGGNPVLYIHDNGIGITSQYQDTIFDLFRKIDPQSDGTGVGLALVKRIIEVHGGKIWMDSQGSGQGTTFYFTLPLAQSGQREGLDTKK